MNNNNYAIAMEHIVETIQITKNEIQIANEKAFIKLRGHIMPIVFEHRLLPPNQEKEEHQSIVIIQGKEIQFGLVVNEFVNQLDVVQKPLDDILRNHSLLSGTSLLGNGEVLFILDPTTLANEQ
jgi:two-component system chemotaxis sensor kinase CheA